MFGPGGGGGVGRGAGVSEGGKGRKKGEWGGLGGVGPLACVWGRGGVAAGGGGGGGFVKWDRGSGVGDVAQKEGMGQV